MPRRDPHQQMLGLYFDVAQQRVDKEEQPAISTNVAAGKMSILADPSAHRQMAGPETFSDEPKVPPGKPAAFDGMVGFDIGLARILVILENEWQDD